MWLTMLSLRTLQPIQLVMSLTRHVWLEHGFVGNKKKIKSTTILSLIKEKMSNVDWFQQL